MDMRTAVVSGGVQGIGKAIARRLIDEGFFTIIADVNEKEGNSISEEFGTDNSSFIKCDISDETEVKSLFSEILKERKTIDALVNNAGLIRDNMIWNMELNDFNMVMDVNLKGTWLMCREAAKIMRRQNSGKIVNITSRAWLGNRGQSNYSSSKAGVVGLTRVLALELGKYNVNVNAVAPGLIDTPLTQNLPADVLKNLIEAQPTKKMGTPDDIASICAFLLSDQSDFITGQVIHVDGGKSIGSTV
jgi:NAD(P)-dependent dehydrogenase (short-subunit alcohol dehydrogenase family)